MKPTGHDKSISGETSSTYSLNDTCPTFHLFTSLIVFKHLRKPMYIYKRLNSCKTTISEQNTFPMLHVYVSYFFEQLRKPIEINIQASEAL